MWDVKTTVIKIDYLKTKEQVVKNNVLHSIFGTLKES